MRYETYETRAHFSYRAVLITLTSHLVVIDFREGRLSTAENRHAFIDLRFNGIPRISSRKRSSVDQSFQVPACQVNRRLSRLGSLGRRLCGREVWDSANSEIVHHVGYKVLYHSVSGLVIGQQLRVACPIQRLSAHLVCSREMRPLAFLDPSAFKGSNERLSRVDICKDEGHSDASPIKRGTSSSEGDCSVFSMKKGSLSAATKSRI